MRISEFLSSEFSVKRDLNPAIWNNNQIIPEVKEKLLTIARHFADYVDVDFPILDVVITGGMTGQYYTEHSDLDLHLITDYQKIDCDQEVEELFDTKKNLYKREYDITIKGIPVELYVEDINRPAIGGSYSLLRDKWLRKPSEPTKNIDSELVQAQTDKLASLLTKAFSLDDLDFLKKTKIFLWHYRKQGLAKEGEFGTANLVFKSLRNLGLLDKLRNRIKELENKSLSLK